MSQQTAKEMLLLTFTAQCVIYGRVSQIFDFNNLRKDHQKNSFKRGDYESVDDKSYLRPCPENQREINSGGRELIIRLGM